MIDRPSVLVASITWNSEAVIDASLRSLASQQGFRLGENLRVVVADNGSSDCSADRVRKLAGEFPGISLIALGANFGFCGANNRIVHEFLAGNETHILLLNADCALADGALQHLVASTAEADLATPLLLRADGALRSLEPPIVDAAGMILTADLRHFDRASGEPATLQQFRSERVFGGTGACLLITRQAVQRLILDCGEWERDVERVFPVLAQGRSERAMLFDEAFFAYREDADLCWRANLLGMNCVFEPKAIGYHMRKVTPERRRELSDFVNRCGVRNRFLLQMNNLLSLPNLRTVIRGCLLRNFIVIAGVLFLEWSSRGAFHELWWLRKRSVARRHALRRRIQSAAQVTC